MQATREIPLPKVKLIETDEQPLETPWHHWAIGILIESLHRYLAGRDDYYIGGNMFVYFSEEQARNLDYRGPDFFFVNDVDGKRERLWWAVWEENGRYPDVIIELLSSSTARTDRTVKKQLYERTFRTREYFCYDPSTHTIEGWRLGADLRYEPIAPDEHGRLWCEELGLWLGTWQGVYFKLEATWPRFFTRQGQLVPTHEEAALQQSAKEKRLKLKEKQRAEKEKQRADKAEAELARLRAQLVERKRGGNGAQSK